MNLAMGMWLCDMWLCLLGFNVPYLSLMSCEASMANKVRNKTEAADGRICTTKLGPMG